MKLICLDLLSPKVIIKFFKKKKYVKITWFFFIFIKVIEKEIEF